jgi:BirA family transcriptional regulator, biotin operon repressor / biotin---[acetyl-CoA-carboxylase] ligase
MRVLEFLPLGRNVSGENLAKSMGVSRAAVHKQIQNLRKKGYLIDGVKNSGYKLVSRGDFLFSDEIESYYTGANPGFLIHYSREIDSTQNRAKFYADRASPERTVVIADKQSAARGRLGREWVADTGGIWFSIILRPGILPDRTPQLTLLASLSLCHAITDLFKVNTGIKWPNDVMVNGRKAAGILTEMSAETDKVNWVVIGIGINANNDLPSFLRDSAVTIKESTGKEVNRPHLAAAFLQQFSSDYEKYLKGGFKEFCAEYNRQSTITGKDVTVFTSEGNIEGKVLKTDNDGRLCVKPRSGGKIARVIAGDVSLKGE